MATNWQTRALAAVYLCARYYAAYTLLRYGLAKVMGAQFTVLDSQLAKPMGEVSGFWLTWYYFGIAPVYSGLVAWAQIGGAVLLCFRRTALPGALILLPVMVNIVCIDHWVIGWGLASDAMRIALYVFAALLVTIGFHGKDLYSFFMRRRDDLARLTEGRWWVVVQVVVVLGMIANTAHDAYWMANRNNRSPTAIDGAWHVVSSEPANAQMPEWIYFEYNRAFMVVLRFADGQAETHDFRVDAQGHTISMGRTWLVPGSDVFDGTWVREGDTLTLRGKWNESTVESLTLRRKEMPVKDHQ